VTEAVGEQTEEGRREDGREEHPTVGHARLAQTQSLGVLEVLDGIGGPEREEHRGVQHVQSEDVPIRPIEFQNLRPIYPLHHPAGRVQARPVTAVQPIENQRRDEPREHGDKGVGRQLRKPGLDQSTGGLK